MATWSGTLSLLRIRTETGLPCHRAGQRESIHLRHLHNPPKKLIRERSGHTTPTSYTGATYTLLTNGQKSNGSHWQFTAKCSGCTTWTGSNGAQRINPGATSQRLAFAWSPTKPGSPGSNTSTIAVHDTPNYWYHDFSKGQNPNFAELLARNGVS